MTAIKARNTIPKLNDSLVESFKLAKCLLKSDSTPFSAIQLLTLN